MDQDKEEDFVQEEEAEPNILETPVDVINIEKPKKPSEPLGLDFAFLFVLYSLLPIFGYYLFG